ncbi:FkbM family methyltransferase [Pendulispora brunnea]|uniref:FkbM family methyltransferase n=1 Tax=Pendulispora brunnea TaxID=2905690 RepID=A0ABZ2KGY7_9BACT
MVAWSRLRDIPRNLSRAPEVARCVAGSSSWASLIPGYLGLRAPRYPFVFRTRNGDSLIIHDGGDLVTAWIIFFRGEYRVKASDRVIVDAGANIGAFSLYAARLAPDARIVALEPFPETRTRLDYHIQVNGLGSRVASRSWALSGRDESRQMDTESHLSQSRGLFGREVANGGLKVEAISLRTFFERESLTSVDLFKMDIEGGEHDVLHSASDEDLRRIRRLALEYHPCASRDVLFDRLRKAGFVLEFDLVDSRDSGVAEFTNTRTFSS